MSLYKIKIIKLEHTFWARTKYPNSWILSTVGNEKLGTNCRQLADKLYVLNGSGISRVYDKTSVTKRET